MRQIRLWALEKNEKGSLIADSVETVEATDTERQLEELLVRSPELLMPGLTLVGRQTPIDGGALDLLGVSEDGNLVVFELKRGMLSREAVGQVVDYASYLSDLDAAGLCKHIAERSGTYGIDSIDDFAGWYEERFPSTPDGYTNPPTMVLVGLGIDDRTKRMVSFLAGSGVDVSAITFHAFKRDGLLFLAKQDEVQMAPSSSEVRQKHTKSANLQVVKALAAKIGSERLVEKVISFLRDALPAYEWPGRSGFSYSLTDRTEGGTPSNRVYVSVYLSEAHEEQLQLAFQKRAVIAGGEHYGQFLKDHADRFDESHGVSTTWIKSEEDWDSLRPSLETVIPHIVEGWKSQTRQSNEPTVSEEED